MTETSYSDFLARRAQRSGSGFEPSRLPDWLFPFQRAMVTWAVRQGRAAIFADCGLGKTPMQLVWADNVVRHANRHVLIVTPLAVSHQVVREAEKFGIECVRSGDGSLPTTAGIVVTNYERLHLFDASRFAGVVCDESSILKNFDGVRRGIVQEFARTLQFRLLCTATAAPNDYVELGTSSEALGNLGHMDMLSRFFRNEQNTNNPNRVWDGGKWRFKKHAEGPFWRWVCSWAMACRSPSDLGFDDARFQLPEMRQIDHVIAAKKPRDGMLFSLPAISMREQREERRSTIEERCDMVAELVKSSDSALVWCHLNEEGDRLERLIGGAVQVSGSDSDDAKEEKLIAFADGKTRVLVIKPKIGAFGLNLQHCAHVTFFPSHSYEQFYQGVRRCWRFGQKRPVRVDVVTTEGERAVMDNLKRKTEAADRMFTELVAHMHDAMRVFNSTNFPNKERIPQWLSSTKN
jgi:hypothetical protein